MASEIRFINRFLSARSSLEVSGCLDSFPPGDGRSSLNVSWELFIKSLIDFLFG
jgi:hypothetical protein